MGNALWMRQTEVTAAQLPLHGVELLAEAFDMHFVR